MQFQKDRRCYMFLRHGGKKNRRNVVAMINRVCEFSDIHHVEQLGKKQIIAFYKSHKHLSHTTLRNYFYAMKLLYKMLGRKGDPPEPWPSKCK